MSNRDQDDRAAARRRYQRGVTLLELMVVVVVVGILASIAVPSYRNYVLRAQRSDATSALLRVAAGQEKFYLQNNTYATTAQLTTLGMTSTEHGWYTVTIAGPDGTGSPNATGFTATATAPSASPQYQDTGCRTFTIDQTGQRDAADAGGTTNATIRERCWR
jgi:type IV pilus assembly protein PilE